MKDPVEIMARAIWLHEQEEKWGKLWMEPDNWRSVQYQDREPYRKIARAVLSALRDAGAIREPNEESAWLIESFHVGHAVWWSRVDNPEDGVTGWSDDSQAAIRFARAQDAQAIIDAIGWTTAKPSEHLWVDPSHKWKFFERYGFTSCEVCGIVQRADGQNGPCKGPVRVGPRQPLPQPPEER